MARASKPTSEAAIIEEEISVLRSKLIEHEHRHADAIAGLDEARQERRRLLTRDYATVEAATKKVRGLQLVADDAASLVADYQTELADAEVRLAQAQSSEQREQAAAVFTGLAEAAGAQIADLTAAAMALLS